MLTLNDKHIDAITKTAVQTALEFLEKEKLQQEKRKHDRRLRNVKLLLRNYRSFVKHCKNIKLELKDIENEIEWTLLDSEEFKLESIKRSKEKTLVMVNYIDKMLAVYKIMSEMTGKPEDARRYAAIHHMYISEDKKTAEEISALQSVAVRTIFLDIEKACKDLSVLVFGLDGVRFHK
ncbi:hypothetical protein [Bacillus sp. FSL K6-3431]|uniref:hypothetical protein n=1 Tax=Bacillus sp. FSL K6-3431 TaxID=2921500 RepID=UPI0030FCB836